MTVIGVLLAGIIGFYDQPGCFVGLRQSYYGVRLALHGLGQSEVPNSLMIPANLDAKQTGSNLLLPNGNCQSGAAVAFDRS
jgi:hypothetical protein